jgi:hypothetical protein
MLVIWGQAAPQSLPSQSEQSEMVTNHHRPDIGLKSREAMVLYIGFGPSRKRALCFCQLSTQRGWSIEETANKLMEVSARAQERARLHDEGYALITAQNAAAAAVRGRQQGSGSSDRQSPRRCPLVERSSTAENSAKKWTMLKRISCVLSTRCPFPYRRACFASLLFLDRNRKVVVLGPTFLCR